MATEIRMPQLSDTMHDGKILSWSKNEGESVEPGDILAEVETDKADLEIECFEEGTILKILAPAGQKVNVGDVIALVGESGEVVASGGGAASVPVNEPLAKAEVSDSVQAPIPQPVSHSNGVTDERLKISPLARNFADANKVDYTGVQGSGEGGRIIKRDIEAVIGSESPGLSSDKAFNQVAEKLRSAPQDSAPSVPVTEGLSRMRETIAARMVESKTTIPHFYMTSAVQVDDLMKMRAQLKEEVGYEGVTINHFIVRACALALKAVPRVNASYQNGSLLQPGSINLGIVTALPEGLLMPVLKDVDTKPLSDVVSETNALIQRARAGKPKSDDLSGATFSISNVGRYKVEEFSAIISPGQGGILAVSSIQDEPVVVNGEIRVGKRMKLTLSVDHRIIDGVVGAEFLTELNRLLSTPVLLLA